MENSITTKSKDSDLQKLRKRLPGRYVPLVQEKLETEYSPAMIYAVLSGQRQNLTILRALISVAEDCEELNKKLSNDSQ